MVPKGYTAHVGGHWAMFLSDAKAALRVWQRFPALPAITLGISLMQGFTHLGWAAIGVAFFFGILWVGWVGTERVIYLRGFRGLSITPGEAWRMTGKFWGRYFWTGIIVLLPYLVVLIPISVVFGASLGDTEGMWGAAISIGLATLVLDVFLTFVTPALAFTTDEPTTAIKVGWRMLREGWPATAWYAVLPPMAFVAITYSQPLTTSSRWVWVLAACVAALLNLLAKGAVAAFYLREHPEVGNDGAAFADQVAPTPTPAGWTAPTAKAEE